MDPRALEVPARDYALEVVVEALIEHVPEKIEVFDMTADEGGELFVPSGLPVHPPAVAQGEDEEIDLGAFPVDLCPDLIPVDLGLPAGRSFGPDRSLREGLLSQEADEPLDCVKAALVSLAPELIKDRPSAVADRGQAASDEVGMRCQGRVPTLFALIGLGLRLPKNLSDRPDIKPEIVRMMNFFDSLSLFRLWILCQTSPLTMSPPEPALGNKDTVLLSMLETPFRMGSFLTCPLTISSRGTVMSTGVRRV